MVVSRHPARSPLIGDRLAGGDRARGRAGAEGPAAEFLPAVRGEPAGGVRAERHDAAGVHDAVDDVVVLLDLREVDRVAEAGGLEEIAGVRPEHRHLGELVPVALEVPVVDGVEAGERREQPDVGLGDRVADEVAARREAFLQQVEAAEQLAVRALVGVLAGREPRLVDGVVDLPVHVRADRVDLVAMTLGVQAGRARPVVLGPLGGQVERDLREVVGDDLAGRDVHDGRHGDAERVVGVAREERLLEALDLQHRVAAARVEVEGPAPLVVGGPADAHGQHGFQAEQPPHDHAAVGPGAGAADDEAVPARFDRIPVPPVGGDTGGEITLIPDVFSPIRGHTNLPGSTRTIALPPRAPVSPRGLARPGGERFCGSLSVPERAVIRRWLPVAVPDVTMSPRVRDVTRRAPARRERARAPMAGSSGDGAARPRRRDRSWLPRRRTPRGRPRVRRRGPARDRRLLVRQRRSPPGAADPARRSLELRRPGRVGGDGPLLRRPRLRRLRRRLPVRRGRRLARAPRRRVRRPRLVSGARHPLPRRPRPRRGPRLAGRRAARHRTGHVWRGPRPERRRGRAVPDRLPAPGLGPGAHLRRDGRAPGDPRRGGGPPPLPPRRPRPAVLGPLDGLGRPVPRDRAGRRPDAPRPLRRGPRPGRPLLRPARRGARPGSGAGRRHGPHRARRPLRRAGGTPVAGTYAYGPDPAQRLDAYFVPGLARPALVIVHGGYWYEEDKYGWATTARWYARHGIAVFAVDYRLGDRAGWTAQRTDVLSAVAWTRAHAAAVGADPYRIMLLGSSSGGQIAAAAGA